MKLDKIVFVLLIILSTYKVSVSQASSQLNIQQRNKDLSQALDLLKFTPIYHLSDSLTIAKERNAINQDFIRISDSLKHNSNDSIYSDFATHRYISLCYSARNIDLKNKYYDTLFFISAQYPKFVEKNFLLSKEISMCIVNSLEGTSGITKKEILTNITTAIEKHIKVVYGINASINQKRKIIDRYVEQYAARGIISMAEPIYRHFRNLYNTPKTETKEIVFKNDYLVYNKFNQVVSNINSSIGNWRIIVFNTSANSFDIVYLISQIRAANKINSSIPFLIARNPNVLDYNSLDIVQRSVSGMFGYFSINNNDVEYYKAAPSFIVQKDDGSFAYSGNNAIDFLEWLEAPFAEQKQIEERKWEIKRLEIKHHKDSIANLPIDTSIKLHRNFNNISITLKGYWDLDVSITLNNYNFGKLEPYYAGQYGVCQVIVTNKSGALIHNQWIINPQLYNSLGIIITADKNQNKETVFSDKLNSEALKYMNILSLNQNRITSYSRLSKDYPFQLSSFVNTIDLKIDSLKKQNSLLINNSKIDTRISSILGITQVMFNLKHPDSKIINKSTFNKVMNIPIFDSIIYQSPFYAPAINSWLDFAANNTKPAIDLLFSSEKWIPTNNFDVAAQNIWKSMNIRAREDMMLYIDTTYLASCSKASVSTTKRIEGYKRMSIGNKAPNIIWDKKGISYQLYNIKSDSIYIIFWSSKCEHCLQYLPKLYNNLQKTNNITVLAINIDDSDSSIKYGNKHFPLWHNIHAVEKWNNDIIINYNVLATPTIYLLNSDKKIIEKLK